MEDLGFLISIFSAEAERSCFPEKQGSRKWKRVEKQSEECGIIAVWDEGPKRWPSGNRIISHWPTQLCDFPQAKQPSPHWVEETSGDAVWGYSGWLRQDRQDS